MAHDQLNKKMSPRDLAAFWTQAATLMRNQRGSRRGSSRHDSNEHDLECQLESIFHTTMGRIKSFGPRCAGCYLYILVPL